MTRKKLTLLKITFDEKGVIDMSVNANTDLLSRCLADLYGTSTILKSAIDKMDHEIGESKVRICKTCGDCDNYHVIYADGGNLQGKNGRP